MNIIAKETRRTPILYTGSLHRPCILADYPEGLARPGTLSAMDRTLYSGRSSRHPRRAWHAWTFWQYSEKGALAGIKGPVDLNFFHADFTELQAFCERISYERDENRVALSSK
jgi:GH25 family lysozyme M1 (1,4-beta-N-acetylmuramidase)